MTTTQQMPVLRASARFSWTMPSRDPAAAPEKATEFGVGVYSNGTVDLDPPPQYAGLVTGLEWNDAADTIDEAAGQWNSKRDWDDRAKKHLLLEATNALRRQMGLPPHVVTPG